MAYTVIDDPTKFHQTALYTGNGGTQSITNDGNSDLQPDLIWIKTRSAVTYHSLSDSASGTDIQLGVNDANAADAFTIAITAFNSDGFSLGSNGNTNYNSRTFAAWQWKGGTTSGIATNGSTTITPSAYSFSQDAGISILKYTGNQTSGAKLAHGLGVKPDMIICKSHGAGGWGVYHQYLGATYGLLLNTTAAKDDDASAWNDVEPDTVNITLGSSINTNKTGTCSGYAFAEKQGFSKFGSYTGNGNADGTFVYTGFKSAFTLFKKTNATSEWFLYDGKRLGFNVTELVFEANSTSAEDSNSGTYIDYLSNGFKIRGTGGNTNASGSTYIYMAFASNPFVTSTGIPTTAR